MAFDNNSLTEFLRKNKTRRAIFAEMLALQEASGRDQIELDALAERLDSTRVSAGAVSCSRKELIDFLRALDEDLEAGSFTIGRRGCKTRFSWRVSSASLKGSVLEDNGPASQVTTPPVSGAPAVRALRHSFILRPDFVVTVELPADVTDHEARRLSQMILSLPMDQGGGAPHDRKE
jgi:hypothetical protein